MAIKPTEVLGAAVFTIVGAAALAVLIIGAGVFLLFLGLIGAVFFAPFL